MNKYAFWSIFVFLSTVVALYTMQHHPEEPIVFILGVLFGRVIGLIFIPLVVSGIITAVVKFIKSETNPYLLRYTFAVCWTIVSLAVMSA